MCIVRPSPRPTTRNEEIDHKQDYLDGEKILLYRQGGSRVPAGDGK